MCVVRTRRGGVQRGLWDFRESVLREGSAYEDVSVTTKQAAIREEECGGGKKVSRKVRVSVMFPRNRNEASPSRAS